MKVFFDSSILLAFLAGQDDRALKMIKEVELNLIDGYINDVVIGEVVYGYLRLTTKLSSQRIRQLLAKRDERLLQLLEDVKPLLEMFTSLPSNVNANEVTDVMSNYGLMPADSIIALTCKKNGVEVIATLDADFRRVPWLRVIP